MASSGLLASRALMQSDAVFEIRVIARSAVWACFKKPHSPDAVIGNQAM